MYKSVYGLKQAPSTWFSNLSAKLLELGSFSSKSNSSLFIYSTSHMSVYVLIYVDDIVVIAYKPSLITEFIYALSLSFPVKDLDALHYLL